MKKHTLAAALASAVVTMGAAQSVLAGGKLEISDDSYVTVGAGLRSSVKFVDDGAPSGDTTSTDFALDSMRLYIGGQLMPGFKFTLNTEKLDGEDMEIIDGIFQYEPMPEFNVWLGRMLTPADRIEMNGPYYALSWNQYTVPLYASDQGGEAGRLGRDEGMTVWGTLGKFQYAVGVFDGLEGGANQDDSVLFATRLAYNFWNMEGNPAYYTSSTYYGGAGDVLTLAVSAQQQSDGAGTVADPADFSGYAVDFLMEKVLPAGGVVTVEGEYKEFDVDLTPAAVADDSCFCLFDGDSYFVTAAYLFSEPVGLGKFQPYVRYNENSPSEGDSSDLTELGLNYVIKSHNLRLNANYTTGDANLSGNAAPDDVDTFTFGVQFQI